VGKFFKGLFKFLGIVVAILLAVTVVLQIFFVNLAIVGHYGMAPTLQAGDQVVVWRGNELDIGDVAVCSNPRDPSDLVMGRVVAKGGMTLRSMRGQIEIEGTAPDVDWGGQMQFRDPIHDRVDTVQLGIEKLGNHEHPVMMRAGRDLVLREQTIPEGEVFLLGDNRHHSADDSRNFGTVRQASCLGTVFLRLLPSDSAPNDFDHGILDIIR
jgi:signal peptidase I